jgi:uncharacterized protein YkwD
MVRIFSVLLASMFLLSACIQTGGSTLASDGKPLPKLYKIRKGDVAKIQFRMLDAVNSLRQVAGASPLTLNAQLNAAAATHSLDMSLQNRPWHFGSDGSSPIDRVRRTGYPGLMLGEVISETYETELETLAAWMQEPGTRAVIVDPRATDLGFSWLQEDNGKIWWTMILGGVETVTAELQ